MNPVFSSASQKQLIGVIHFPPLLGVEGTPGLDVAAQNALADLRAFEDGGVDAVIIENNYDLPHLERVASDAVASMTALGLKIRAATKLSIGVCVLWNDYEASFTVAKKINAQFIRIPVFIDQVETDFGRINGNPSAVMAARHALQAENVRIVADIHVKHSKILSGTTIAEAAAKAQAAGADAVIVTGDWTGQSPKTDDLASVRASVPDLPLFAGSGVSAENAADILRYADGAIVSTSLKEGASAEGERNVKTWHQRIDVDKVRKLAGAMHA